MGRRAKPWFRKGTGWWMVVIGGKQYKLAEGKENRLAAEDQLRELRSIIRRAPEALTVRVCDLCDEYLAWIKANRKPETYRGQLFYCQKFAEQCGDLAVRDLRPFHISRWMDAKPSWGNTTRHTAIRIAKSVFNWAVRQRLIDSNPIAGVERPQPKHRGRGLTDEERTAILKAARGRFKEIITAMLLTGTRPGEICQLKWSQVMEDMWVLAEHKTAGKTGRPRVIHLVPEVQKLMRSLRKETTSEYVFVNTRGLPWNRDSLRQHFACLRDKLGLSKELCPYMTRHTFATQALINGVPIADVAELLGHTSTEMVSRVYGHLSHEHEHLARAAMRAVAKSPKSRKVG